jgi:TPR repeat protein
LNENLPEFHDAILRLEDFLAADDKSAIDCQLRALAMRGKKFPYSEVAELYESGNERISPRLDLAFEWYWKSAYEENDGTGFFGIARFYFDGRHVDKDRTRSLELFHRAHMLGSAEAGVMLAYCYLKGFGAAKDLVRAEEFSLVAANAGYPVASYFLAMVECARRHYFRALKFWWKCISQTRRLTIQSPSHRNLYLLHGMWKL